MAHNYYNRTTTFDNFFNSHSIKSHLKLPINILFLHYGAEQLRGSEHSFLTLLTKLNRNIFFPVVICNNQILYNELQKIGIEVYHYAFFPEITIDGHYNKIQVWQYAKTVLWFYKFMKGKKIKLIYSNSGLPTQVGYLLSRIYHLPIITHLHASHSLRYAWMWLFKFSDKIIFVSNAIKNDLANKVNFHGKLRVVYNGIDADDVFLPERDKNNRLRLREKLCIGKNDIVLGQVGALVYLKGCDIAIKAMAIMLQQNSNVKLVFIGDGEERGLFITLAKELNIKKHVLFLGEKPNPEIYYKHLFDINILASRSEAFGRVLIEGASCGLPSIASNVGGIPEIIDNGHTGYLFRNEDVLDLANKCLKLVNNLNLKKKMGNKAREKVLKKFCDTVYVANIEREILDML